MFSNAETLGFHAYSERASGADHKTVALYAK